MKMSEFQNRKKDKNQHIQVFVRVRPANQQELLGKSTTVIDVPTNREIVVRERVQDKHTKKFTFDRVFGPTSKQLDVYNAVASPLLDEVLAGYNCTVFAYGQTGTGKTFTMEGASNDPALHWQSDTSAGLIPRALSHLFDELRLMGSQEYTVRVSFLELYNEELFDLLSPTDDASKIRIYDDASKRGAVIIQGLEEVTVHNKNEVYKILEKGSERRQTAATLMNAASSRSHTVFSITVHIRENTVEGEELLKTGKLNLVDLAGSENVGRSGAVDKRAREAGNINQSLLTLGRVITALVERTPHVPYRESKLTRLLQESLGGRTKTSIIATISPASINLEETLSTLDYAHRAKNITNRPEINQKLTKKALLKEYTEEIERLRRDLQASRERNGVYLAHENYNEMQSTIEFQGKEIEEKLNHIKALEETMLAKEKLLSELKIDLKSTKRQVELTEQERDEQKHLVEKHLETENKLFKQAKTLLNVADVATTDTYKLYDKIMRKQTIEDSNMSVSEIFRENIRKKFLTVQEDVTMYADQLTNYYLSSQNNISEETGKYTQILNKLTERISEDLIKNEQEITEKIKQHCEISQKNNLLLIEKCIQNASIFTNTERDILKNLATDLAPMITQLVNNQIKENLEIINNEMTTNINNLVEHFKELTDKICTEFIQSRNHIQYELNAVKKNLEYSRERQTKLAEINTKLSQRMSVFTEDFIALRNEQDEENSRIIDSFDTELEICSSLDREVEKITTIHEELKSVTDKEFPTRIDTIVTNLSSDIKHNCDISAQCIEQSQKVIEQLQNQLEKNSQNLSTYQDQIQTNLQEINVQSQSERSDTLIFTEHIDKIVRQAAEDHETYANQLGQAIQENFKDTNEKLEEQLVTAADMQKNLVFSLHETHNNIEKFIAEDLKQDQPTGQTPIKRDFQYPRHLTATSPHEKILERFRTLRYPQGPADNDDVDDSPHQFLVPNNIRSSNLSLSTKSRQSDDDMHHAIVRSASTSDISSVRDKSPLNNGSIVSECDQTPLQNNKENKDEIGSAPKFSKYGYKGKSAKTVLRSRNDIA